MAFKREGSPINIAPFVDVLLVIFVMLAVAARFDSPNQKEIQQLNALIFDQANQIASLEDKKNTSASSAAEKKEVIRDTQVVTKVVKETVEDTTRLAELQSKIQELEEALEKSKKSSGSFKIERDGGGATANILFGIDGQITVNGERVTEDFVYALIKTVHPDITVGWKGRGHETAYKFEEFAKSQGYNSKGLK